MVCRAIFGNGITDKLSGLVIQISTKVKLEISTKNGSAREGLMLMGIEPSPTGVQKKMTPSATAR
jgi:hypothetical protein